jgi:hypothetical protein
VAAEEYFRKAIEAGLIECYLDLIDVRREAGDSEALNELIGEAVDAGEITYPMVGCELRGDHDAADELALQAATCGHVEPLRRLVWGRLRHHNVERAAALAQRACDAGQALIVRGMCEDEHEQFSTSVLFEVMRGLTDPAAVTPEPE